jgi:hypothetical protein
MTVAGLRLRRAAAAAALAAVALGAAGARAQTERPLGKLEQQSLDEALAAMGLVVDPHPAGKTIGMVAVVNQDVFSRHDWYFQLFNIFHRTTRAEILRRELLFAPGQPYDQAIIEESMRNLQTTPSIVLATGQPVPGPELSSVVVIVPLASRTPGIVDVLVVTRDVWSLRFNTNFELQQKTISLLDTSLSENNLFGWRKFLSVGFLLNLGNYAIGPTYLDPNLAGTRLQLYTNAVAFYTRGTNDYEGNAETVSLVYPLFSLASRWGAGLAVAHEDAVLRQFTGTGLTLVPLALAPGVTAPLIFRRRFAIVDASGTRSFGAAVIQRLTLGYRFDDRHSLPLETFDYGVPPGQVQELVGQYAPISELRSEPYLRYTMFTPRYAIYRDLNTFDLRENQQLGPSVTLGVAYGAPELGADFRAFPLSASVGWAVGPGGGLASVVLTGALRLRDGQAIDEVLQGKLYLASPLFRRLLRVVLSAETDAARNDTQHIRYALGGDTGLRGYIIGEFQGATMVIGHAELRSAPLAVYSQRVGAVLFCDVGDAAPTFSVLQLRTDVGLGLRWLIPQLNSSVIRVDWAVPLVDGIETRAGFPGRASAGFQQIF